MKTVFVGVRRTVVAIDKETGQELWRTTLPGGLGDTFVSLSTDGVHVFAHGHGELYCLDADSGRIRWANGLSGLGYGIASVCAAAGSSDGQSAIKAQEAANATAAASAAS